MFSVGEIRRNLLGSLEVALFMPDARGRFGDGYEEALRSFLIPALLFPLSLLAVYMYPRAEIAGASHNMIALLYSLRMVFVWLLFLGAVWMIVREIDRKEYFYKFVIANNWLTVPATLIFLPVAWLLISGAYSWNELYPLMVCIMGYTYIFTAFMAAYILRVPWELAGFISFIAICINQSTLDIVHQVGQALQSL